jgi:hypothetical protein
MRRIHQWRQYIAKQYNILHPFSFMLLHLLVCKCVCAKKRNFSLWIETAGILSIDGYGCCCCCCCRRRLCHSSIWTFFFSRLSYRLADIVDVFLRTVMTDHQQKKEKREGKNLVRCSDII